MDIEQQIRWSMTNKIQEVINQSERGEIALNDCLGGIKSIIADTDLQIDKNRAELEKMYS